VSVRRTATPAAFSKELPRCVAPSSKATFPVGIPPDEVTEAVNVIAAPGLAFAGAASVTVVARPVTCASVRELLGKNVASPWSSSNCVRSQTS
jgi:hypothetical protein